MPQDSLERALLDGLPAAEGLRQVIHTPVHLARPGSGGRRGGRAGQGRPEGLEGAGDLGWRHGAGLNPRKDLRAPGAEPPPGDGRSGVGFSILQSRAEPGSSGEAVGARPPPKICL